MMNMNGISILDCTLRDGGYINNWNFGNLAVGEIINLLNESNVDIIECGFLRDEAYDTNRSVFSSVEDITPLITPKKEGITYVAMIALGDIDISNISNRDDSSIDGIRLTFHKGDWEEEKQAAIELMKKGYDVFIQPVGTATYSDDEFLELIDKVNEVQPYAFYLVDTLGTMYKKDLSRMFFMADNNLNRDIVIGFHSHNNLQLSFSNAQELMSFNTKRHIIVDSSVSGMGRGAGNLPTELITQYVNENLTAKYKVMPLLSIIDRYLDPIYEKTPWGYSTPYYLASIYNCHPNYANNLMQKEKLSVEEIGKLLNMIPSEERSLYNSKLIETLYINYQNNQIDDTAAIETIKGIINGENVLILGPGKTIRTHIDKVNSFIENNKPYIISVNFIPNEYKSDIIFISNSKRMSQIENIDLKGRTLLLTSNVPSSNNSLNLNYSSLLGEGRDPDDAGMMLMRLLRKVGVRTVYLAGFDGYDVNSSTHIFTDSYVGVRDYQERIVKNQDMEEQLSDMSSKINIVFITPTNYSVKGAGYE